jgi:carboxynorspermidine decarboxylase
MLKDNPDRLQHINGMQFHSNCDSTDFAPILTTVKHITDKLGPMLLKLEWFNLGGGYLLHEDSDYTPLYEAIELLQTNYDLRVYFEPGAAFVREAGYIVSSVIDLFESNDQMIAVLDTTINHMQEVYEYQFEPNIYGQNHAGKYRYQLAGSTCLAGDLLGKYNCNTPLEIGSKLIFTDMGAYTQVKAHMFNGVNMPHLYLLNDKGLRLRKTFTYEDFISRC